MVKLDRTITTTRLTWRAIFPMGMPSGTWKKSPLNAASPERRVLSANFDLFPLSRLIRRGQAPPGRFPGAAESTFCAGIPPHLYCRPYCSKFQGNATQSQSEKSANAVNFSYIRKKLDRLTPIRGEFAQSRCVGPLGTFHGGRTSDQNPQRGNTRYAKSP